MGSYTGGHIASGQKQIDKRTTMNNQNRSVALGRPDLSTGSCVVSKGDKILLIDDIYPVYDLKYFDENPNSFKLDHQMYQECSG